jgi:hypothetical protein
MIVEGPRSAKRKAQVDPYAKISGRVGRYFGTGSGLVIMAVSSFLDREIPREPEMIELFKSSPGRSLRKFRRTAGS